MPLLELRAIGKSFPGVDALRNVALVAHRGEVHALVGANGAGKSTLIGLLSGLFPPTTGSIGIAGREVKFRSPREARISTVYQELAVLPNLSVAENIFLGREPRSRFGLVDFARLHADAQQLFDRFGLHLDPTTLVDRLSVGQRQIVELGRALSTASRILILDELTAGLSVRELVRLMVGHDLSDRFHLPAVDTNATKLETKVMSATGSSQFALRS